MSEINEGQVLLHYVGDAADWDDRENQIYEGRISYAWGDIQPKWSGGANVDMYWVAEHHRLAHVIEDDPGLLYPRLVSPDEPKEKGRGITQGPVRTTGSYADPDNKNNYKPRGRKVADNIDCMSLIGLDVDDGFPMWRMAEILSGTGYMFWMCPTYSHGKTAMTVPGKEIFKHDPDPQKAALAYLAKKGIADDLIAEIGDVRIEGPDVIIPHPVLQKYRVFLFAGFEENFFKIHNDGADGWRYTERQQMWSDAYKRLWQDLGVPAVFDSKCGTVDRFFYTPKFPNNKPLGNPIERPTHFGAVWSPGEFFPLAEKVEAAAEHVNKYKSFSLGVPGGGNKNGRLYIPRDPDLIEVAKLPDFPLLSFVHEQGNPDHIRATKGDKIEVKCPWEADHSVEHGPTSSACWVAGDGGEHSWVIACQSEGCSDENDASRGQGDRLKFLDYMCREGELLEGVTGRQMLDWYYAAQGIELPDFEADIFDEIEKLSTGTPVRSDAVKELIEKVVGLPEEDQIDAVVELAKKTTATRQQLERLVKKEAKRQAQNAIEEKAEKTAVGKDGRLTVYDHADVKQRVEGIAHHIVEANKDDPEVFLLATGEYGRSYINSSGITVSTLDLEKKDSLLTDTVNYLKAGKEGDIPLPVPGQIKNAVFGSKILYSHTHQLKQVVKIPFFDSDGQLLVEPGYVPSLQMLHDPNIELADVAPNPTDDDIDAALDIIDDLLHDFPFSDDFEGVGGTLPIYNEDGSCNRERGRASRANFVGCMLTPMVRAMIDGSVPMAHIDKSQPNTGGTKLLSLVTILYDGERPPMLELRSGDEFGKMILPIIESGRPLICFDNIDTGIKADNKTLAGAVTSGKFEGRILGKSQVVSVPLTSMIWTVGNNFFSTDELTRRMVPIRLDAEDPQPQNRAVWRHPLLEAYALEHRSDLIWACHTLVSAWVADGKKPWSGKVSDMSSFESWASVVGGIMESVWPEPDAFLANLDAFRGQNQDEQKYGAELVQCIYDYQYGRNQGQPLDFQTLKQAAFDDAGDCKVSGMDFNARANNFARDFKRQLRSIARQTVEIAVPKAGAKPDLRGEVDRQVSAAKLIMSDTNYKVVLVEK